MTGSERHPLEEHLGYRFEDPAILREALTHSTYANEHPDWGPHNERLEFLGDSVVGLLVADILYGQGDTPEGAMTKRRARVVRREGLAAVARDIELGRHLRLGEGQRRAGGGDSDRLLADALEALVGAVLRDGGLEAVRGVFGSRFEDAVASASKPIDFKTALQERAHEHGHSTPAYVIASIEGPDHARIYTAEVYLDGECLGRGSGSSKKSAEQSAAELALSSWSDP